MADEKKTRLVELDIHRRKLSDLIGELLKKADEIDQHSKLLKRQLGAPWHERLAHTCRDLANLSAAVAESAQLLKDGKLKTCEDLILRSTEIATRLSHRLNELKAEAHD